MSQGNYNKEETSMEGFEPPARDIQNKDNGQNSTGSIDPPFVENMLDWFKNNLSEYDEELVRRKANKMNKYVDSCMIQTFSNYFAERAETVVDELMKDTVIRVKMIEEKRNHDCQITNSLRFIEDYYNTNQRRINRLNLSNDARSRLETVRTCHALVKLMRLDETSHLIQRYNDVMSKI